MATTKKTTVATAKETPAKKVAVEVSEVKAAPKKTMKKDALQAEVLDMKGKVIETITLSQEVFGAPINETLMAQAVRVYLANQRKGTASTKSRGEVTGSTRKIYRQKGTGRARHGGVRAPIFVGGGIAFGPKPRDYSLSMPQKMRQRALLSALTTKYQDGGVTVVSGLENIEPKTKEFASVLSNLKLDTKKRKILLVLAEKSENLQRAARNIEGVEYMLANQLNTYEVLNTRNLVFLKNALEKVEKTFGKGEK